VPELPTAHLTLFSAIVLTWLFVASYPCSPTPGSGKTQKQSSCNVYSGNPENWCRMQPTGPSVHAKKSVQMELESGSLAAEGDL
jgi:hypothetical protein